MGNDHEGIGEQRFRKQLPAQKEERDAVRGQEVEEVGMAVGHSAGHSHSRRHGEYGHRDTSGGQVEALVIAAPGGPHEEQAGGYHQAQPSDRHLARGDLVEGYEVHRGSQGQQKHGQLEKPNSRANAIHMERLKLAFQFRRKTQIREIPPQLGGVGRVRKVVEVEGGGHLHWG